MKVLVLSDSHSSLSFMRLCAEKLQPDTILHLGDYYDDGEVIREEFPRPLFLQVPGNCDMYRTPPFVSNIIIRRLAGVQIYMTHGHLHYVKQGLGNLIADARRARADLVLFGHTHIPHCEQLEDGMWVVNPGTCGYGGGTAAVIELDDGQVKSCRIVTESDLFSME